MENILIASGSLSAPLYWWFGISFAFGFWSGIAYYYYFIKTNTPKEG